MPLEAAPHEHRFVDAPRPVEPIYELRIVPLPPKVDASVGAEIFGFELPGDRKVSLWSYAKPKDAQADNYGFKYFVAYRELQTRTDDFNVVELFLNYAASDAFEAAKNQRWLPARAANEPASRI